MAKLLNTCPVSPSMRANRLRNPSSSLSFYLMLPHASSLSLYPSHKNISNITTVNFNVRRFTSPVGHRPIEMAEHQPSQLHGGRQQPRSHQLVKAATAVTAGGSLLVLSCLTLAGTVIVLIFATPFLVIFSPVIVPAVVAAALLITGFLASGGFGVAAITVLSWIYRYVTGRQPLGADQLDQARQKMAGKAREMRDRAEQFGQQQAS